MHKEDNKKNDKALQLEDKLEIREKLRTSEFRDVNLEKLILAGILHNTIIYRKLKDLNPELFSSDRMKFIFEQIIDFENNSSYIPDTEAFEICIKEQPIKDRKSLMKIWNKIQVQKVEPSACMAGIARLKRLYRARLVQYKMGECLSALKKADSGGDKHIDDAIKIYTSFMDETEAEAGKIILSDPIERYDKFKKWHKSIQKDPNKHLGVMTGMEKLDERMGGLRPGEFGLISAATGRGKSILLLDFSFYCFLSQGDVIYVTIEMPGEQMWQRFYCRLAGIPYNNFRDFKLTKEHFERLDKKVKGLKEHDYKFRILDIPQSCTVTSLRNELEKYMQKTGQPKEIVIDYMNIMKGGFDWQKQLEIAVEIKQMIARYFKIATWSANQLSGSKSEKEHVKISDMGFAKNIADNVDVGIGIGMTDNSDDEEIFNIDFLKTRDFSAKGFQVQADRSRMTFSNMRREKKMKFNEKKTRGKIKT